MVRIDRKHLTRSVLGASLAFLRVCIVALGLPGVALSAGAAGKKSIPPRQPTFREFIDALWPNAQERGVSRATFDNAFAGLAFDPKVVANAQSQPEFVRPIWEYIASAVTPDRIERGRDRARSEDLGSPGPRRPLASTKRYSWASGGWRRTLAVLPGRTLSFRRLRVSLTPIYRATTFETNCSRRLPYSRRATSLRPSCAALGQARWGRRSSCLRAIWPTPSPSSATIDATFGRAKRTLSARPRIIWRNMAGQGVSPGGSRFGCRQNSG